MVAIQTTDDGVIYFRIDVLPGDVDNNYVVDADDIAVFTDWGLFDPNTYSYPEEIFYVDMQGDGVIDTGDTQTISDIIQAGATTLPSGNPVP